MARFLFCLPRFHTNGSSWIRILQEAGHHVAVHCMIRGPTESYTRLEPTVFEQSKLSVRLGATPANDLRLFPDPRVAIGTMEDAAPDVVIVRGLTRWFSRMSAAIAISKGTRLVVYDQEPPKPDRIGTCFRRAACSLVGIDHFTPKIDETRRHSFGSARQLPFGNPFEKDKVQRLATRPLHWPPRILMVAKYRERKRHADLLVALGALVPTHNFSLTLCGEEASEADVRFCERLRQLSQTLGLRKRLFFRNNVPHHEMAGLYGEHDLFVLPAINEPAAVSPLEAVWCGCASIVTHGSGTRSYLPPDETYGFRDGDASDLMLALRKVLSSPHALTRSRDACVRRLSTVANDGRILHEFERMLQ